MELTGRIVGMRHGRGSSSSSSVLAEALRLGTGPAGFILGESDSILVIGALVGRRLYQASCPVLVGLIPMQNVGPWEIDCDKSPSEAMFDQREPGVTIPLFGKSNQSMGGLHSRPHRRR